MTRPDNARAIAPSEVSVVIPAYNAAAFIAEALDSIARQSMPPGEVLVVNDGSKDDTRRVVEGWIAGGPRPFAVTLFNQENRGIAPTRNLGISRARGRWIALLDADDVWEPEHLEQLLSALRLRADAIAAYGAGRQMTDGIVNETLYDDFWDNPSREYGQPIPGSICSAIDSRAIPRLARGNFIKPSSFVFCKAVVDEIGLFNESLRTAEDREFFVRLLSRGVFVYNPTPITRYRWHDDNISQSRNEKMNLENGLRALTIIQRNRRLSFNADERSLIRREQRASAQAYLYACCNSGLRTYVAGWKVVRQLLGWPSAVSVLNLRHIVKSVVVR